MEQIEQLMFELLKRHFGQPNKLEEAVLSASKRFQIGKITPIETTETFAQIAYFLKSCGIQESLQKIKYLLTLKN
jgi:hypothetical protein